MSAKQTNTTKLHHAIVDTTVVVTPQTVSLADIEGLSNEEALSVIRLLVSAESALRNATCLMRVKRKAQSAKRQASIGS